MSIKITIDFYFAGDTTCFEEFDICEDLKVVIDEYQQDKALELQREPEGWEVTDWDTGYNDFQGLDRFKTFADWVEYCCKADAYGNSFTMRYADIGEHDHDAEYQGCWDSLEEFSQERLDPCGEGRIPADITVNWDATTIDFMQAYSSYQDSDGYHIFADI